MHTFHTPTLHPPPPPLSLPYFLCPSITGYNHPVVIEALATDSLSTLANRPALLVQPPMDFVQRIKNTLLSVSHYYAFLFKANYTEKSIIILGESSYIHRRCQPSNSTHLPLMVGEWR